MTVDPANMTYARQRDILDPGLAAVAHVTVCGVGTVGSNAAMQLAKMGIGKLTLYDMDTVGMHNIPSQDFTHGDVDSHKVDALVPRLKAVNANIEVTAIRDPLVGAELFDSEIVILAVDSMSMRRKIFETSVRGYSGIEHMMDFRMDASNIQWWNISTHRMDQADRYADTLYSDEATVSSPCGGRTFAPVGAMTGAIAAQSVAQVLNHEGPPFYAMLDMKAWFLAPAGA